MYLNDFKDKTILNQINTSDSSYFFSKTYPVSKESA